MNLYQKKIERIKNMKGFVLKRDFSYGSISFVCLAVFLALGAVVQLLVLPIHPAGCNRVGKHGNLCRSLGCNHFPSLGG